METTRESASNYHGLALKIKNQLLLGVIVTLLISGFAILAGLIIRISRPDLSDETFVHVTVWTIGGILIGSLLSLRLLSRSLKSINQVERGIYDLAAEQGAVVLPKEMPDLSTDGSLDVAYQLLLERLYKAEDLHQDFLSLICHQIRSPIATIINYTELLSDPAYQDDSEFFQHSHEVILKQGMKICEFTDDVLTVAALNAKRINLKMDLIHLGPFLEKIVEDVSLETRCEICFENQAGDVVIWGDAYRIRQALIKLIEKCKNGSSNHLPISVNIKASHHQNFVEIPVSDQESNFSHRETALISEHLQNNKSLSPKEIHSSWLGLFIANHIVHSHNGNISLHSEPGKGSTFTIRIPVAYEWQNVSEGAPS